MVVNLKEAFKSFGHFFNTKIRHFRCGECNHIWSDTVFTKRCPACDGKYVLEV